MRFILPLLLLLPLVSSQAMAQARELPPLAERQFQKRSVQAPVQKFSKPVQAPVQKSAVQKSSKQDEARVGPFRRFLAGTMLFGGPDQRASRNERQRSRLQSRG